MPTFKDITGQRFGRLIALRRNGKALKGIKSACVPWLCQCDCGKTVTVPGGSLRSGHTQSCGCVGKNFRHGHSPKHKPTPTYISWRSMLHRCYNPNIASYKYYGALGISVCVEWMEFKTFLSDMGERPSGKTLDRIDPFKNYERSNCRWATPMEQRHNWRQHYPSPRR